jgi:hypothetical protein
MKKLGIVLICIMLLALISIASAAPAPNKGTDVSAQKAADVAKANANANAAFNRIASAPTVGIADCVYAIYYETESDYENDINGILMGPIIPPNSPDGFIVTGVLVVCGEVTFG